MEGVSRGGEIGVSVLIPMAMAIPGDPFLRLNYGFLCVAPNAKRKFVKSFWSWTVHAKYFVTKLLRE